MSAIALGKNSPDFEPFVSWYRKRPTQLAFAASVLVHALLIAVMPGFRSVSPDTQAVLTVQIVNKETPPVKAAVPQKVPETKPVVRKEETVPEMAKPVDLPAPPDLVVPAPQPRAVEQTPVTPRPVLSQQPAPVVPRPEQSQVPQVADAELVPAAPQQRPRVRPIITSRPELAPQRPTVPVIQPQTTARVEEPLQQPVDLRPQPRVVRQTPASAVRPQPLSEAPPPDALVPSAAPARAEAPVVAAPSAPAPVRQVAPVKPAQPNALAAVAPPVTTAVAKPSAPAPVAAPAPTAPPQPVVEQVEASVLEAYRQSVSLEVMRHMKYPMLAVRRKWQGKAVVEMQLSDDGAVTRVVLVESTGKEVLDDAALAMIRDSLPLPKPPRGVRSVKVPVVFRLQG
jgi:protein TonB